MTDDPMTRRNFYIPDDVWRAARKSAIAQGISISEYLRRAIVKQVKKDEVAGPKRLRVE